jgi:hypothetical protein
MLIDAMLQTVQPAEVRAALYRALATILGVTVAQGASDAAASTWPVPAFTWWSRWPRSPASSSCRRPRRPPGSGWWCCRRSRWPRWLSTWRTTPLPSRMGWCSRAVGAPTCNAATSARLVWRPAVQQLGLDGLRFHDLRHTAATLAAAVGATTKELMERMGHTSAAVALRYQHVMADRQGAIAAALDGLVRDAQQAGRRRPRARGGHDGARWGSGGRAADR